jgi:[acyl-carrier-protein] S-malonyltransferase
MSKQAWVFPGQGSQYLGMLHDLVDSYPQIIETFTQASDVLGYDLWDVVQHHEDKLNQTHITQPALLAASYALYKIVKAKGHADAAYFAGHSLGEYSALVCAGVMAFGDALRLVAARGQFMQDAVPAGQGAMYAIIGLDDDKVVSSCQQAQIESNEVVAAVNFNSPGQVVIAGTTKAAQLAAQYCKDNGAKRALPLAVSAPSHCALMQPAAKKLAAMLADMTFSAPNVAVINNVDVAMPTDPEAIKLALVKQLYSPVRWTETVEYMAAQGVSQVYEIGPGKVLCGLIKRIDKTLSCEALNTLDTLQS